MGKIIWSIAIIVLIASACNSNASQKQRTEDSAVESPSTQQADIPYEVAKNYFAKNTITDIPFNKKITTRREFDNYFGYAAIMGEDGKPTPIDFSSQYVIAIVEDISDQAVSILPRIFGRVGEKIIFSYKVEKGEKRSYTVRPLLLLVVDNAYNGEIQFEKE